MYGADPKHFPLGTKSGCRRIFSECGVPHPLGFEDLQSLDEVVHAILKMRAARAQQPQKPDIAQVLIKLNEGVSGEGNALVDLAGWPKPGAARDEAAEHDAVAERLRAMRFELEALTYADYVAKLNERGGIVEERIQGQEFKSPSVQLRVNPLGKLEVLSTHDQLLGGPSGQSYLGCIFPANQEYAALITREAVKVGERLAREGVIGRFALDFVVVRSQGGAWQPYAIEINLRKGGTTHPFLTLQFLTDGSYDPEAAVFTAPSGRRKYFVASDHAASPLYRAFTPDDLFDLVVRRGLHFDQARQTGVVFHMMSALGECGSLGLVAVGESPEEANALYQRTLAVLDEEAQAAVRTQALK
jgi:hypothetical protein